MRRKSDQPPTASHGPFFFCNRLPQPAPGVAVWDQPARPTGCFCELSAPPPRATSLPQRPGCIAAPGFFYCRSVSSLFATKECLYASFNMVSPPPMPMPGHAGFRPRPPRAIPFWLPTLGVRILQTPQLLVAPSGDRLRSGRPARRYCHDRKFASRDLSVPRTAWSLCSW